MNFNHYSTVSNVYYDWCHEDQNGETQKYLFVRNIRQTQQLL